MNKTLVVFFLIYSSTAAAFFGLSKNERLSNLCLIITDSSLSYTCLDYIVEERHYHTKAIEICENRVANMGVSYYPALQDSAIFNCTLKITARTKINKHKVDRCLKVQYSSASKQIEHAMKCIEVGFSIPKS